MNTAKTSLFKAVCPNPECRSSWTMWRQKTKTFLCRKCGTVFARPEQSDPAKSG
jgi:ribosomal protein L37AE/L43A